MTFLHLRHHEVGALRWGFDTLRPPGLTPGNLARDLLWELGQCRAARLALPSVAGFLLLRILQRIAYNLGWWEGRTT